MKEKKKNSTFNHIFFPFATWYQMINRHLFKDCCNKPLNAFQKLRILQAIASLFKN